MLVFANMLGRFTFICHLGVKQKMFCIRDSSGQRAILPVMIRKSAQLWKLKPIKIDKEKTCWTSGEFKWEFQVIPRLPTGWSRPDGDQKVGHLGPDCTRDKSCGSLNLWICDILTWWNPFAESATPKMWWLCPWLLFQNWLPWRHRSSCQVWTLPRSFPTWDPAKDSGEAKDDLNMCSYTCTTCPGPTPTRPLLHMNPLHILSKPSYAAARSSDSSHISDVRRAKSPRDGKATGVVFRFHQILHGTSIHIPRTYSTYTAYRCI